MILPLFSLLDLPMGASTLPAQAVVLLVVVAVTVWIARNVAVKRALLDQPNERSSHRRPVPRLGGAAFVPVLLLALLLVSGSLSLSAAIRWAFIAGALVLYAIGVADDLFSLSSLVRLLLQGAVALGFLSMAMLTDAGGLAAWVSWAVAAAGVVWVVAALNIYNFMDGIDGIAGLQGAVAGLAWFAIGVTHGSAFVTYVGAFVAATALGFLFFNWSPASIFMGDAGSTVLGYMFATLPFLLIAESRGAVHAGSALLAGGLIIWPFMADGVFTILRRLKKGENILRAHRSHLYQRLVISSCSHRCVTTVYGLWATVCAALGVRALDRGPSSWLLMTVVPVLGLVAVWAWTVRREAKGAGA